MIAIVHSIYSQSVHAPALNAGLMDEAERYCIGGILQNWLLSFTARTILLSRGFYRSDNTTL